MENPQNQENMAFVPVFLVCTLWLVIIAIVFSCLYLGVTQHDQVVLGAGLVLLVGVLVSSVPQIIVIYFNSKQNYKTNHWWRAIVFGSLSTIGMGLYSSNLYRNDKKQESYDVMMGAPLSFAVTKNPKSRMYMNIFVFGLIILLSFLSYMKNRSFGKNDRLSLALLVIWGVWLFFRNRQEKTGVTNPLQKDVSWWYFIPVLIVLTGLFFVLKYFLLTNH
jgi:hypothetical protein